MIPEESVDEDGQFGGGDRALEPESWRHHFHGVETVGSFQVGGRSYSVGPHV